MPNTIGPNGLTTKTRQDYIDSILNGDGDTPGLYSIFGADINVDTNSPDGNLVQVMAQVAADVTDLLTQIYNGMDPDQAIGATLDQRVTINGVTRKAGTYSTQFVTVTVSQALTLAGLDTAPDNPFTIRDASGNQFQLMTTTAFGGAGSSDLNFQSAVIGSVTVAPNTLTTIVTPQVGVASVTNGTLEGTVGVTEEADYSLRIRRQNSVALPSTGYFDGLYGGLVALAGVTDVHVEENTTGSTVGSVPAHSIWCIVEGGTNADIADVIYRKRSAGCGMYGDVDVAITRADGSTMDIFFSRPIYEDLWISFNVTAITGTFDAAYIRQQLLAQLSYTIGQPADASEIVALVKAIAPNVYVDSEGVSDADSGYVSLKATTGINYKWATAGARIKINGATG